MDPNPVEIRVLGCLVEKQRTTPDAYPLTLNALRLACNQTTNRDPVVAYDEPAIEAALGRLRERRWVRVASMPGRRTVKYRHLLDEALGLDDPELAVLAVLMLRGAQTPGELKQRTERLHGFAGLDELEATLGSLAERGLAARLERRAGEKQARCAQLLSGEPDAPEQDGPPVAAAGADDELAARVERLEREVAELHAELAALRSPGPSA